MSDKTLEKLQARIMIQYEGSAGKGGRTIIYIYNRETLDTLNIKRQTYDNSQFIEVGDKMTLEGYECEVVQINFKLEDHLNKMEHGFGINLLSPTDPTNFNCQIGVFVKRLE